MRCIHVEGSGCYGHNGADDAAADAALIARAMPGRPIRVQWMREQENGWEPYGAGDGGRGAGRLDASGRIVDWDYADLEQHASTRPGPAGSLLAGAATGPALPAAAAQADPDAGGRGRSQLHPDLHFPSANV